MDQLEKLSKLIENRNEIDDQISGIIGYSGAATSVIDELWKDSGIHPNPVNISLILSENQKNRLKLFDFKK